MQQLAREVTYIFTQRRKDDKTQKKINLKTIKSYSLSEVLFKLKLGMGETMSGNFSTVTFDGSRPKPLSSERLTSFNQKYNFMIILSKNGNSLSWLKYFSITIN